MCISLVILDSLIKVDIFRLMDESTIIRGDYSFISDEFSVVANHSSTEKKIPGSYPDLNKQGLKEK